MQLYLAKQVLERLEQLIGSCTYEFLGYELDLEKGEIKDKAKTPEPSHTESRGFELEMLLTHYAASSPTPLTGKLMKFGEIPGGSAYEQAFVARAVAPIAETFGNKPEELLKSAVKLNGKTCCFGDVSAQVEALKGVPLTYVLWKADEFPAEASVLFDSSASSYLPTEDLAVLGELTTDRLTEIYGV